MHDVRLRAGSGALVRDWGEAHARGDRVDDGPGGRHLGSGAVSVAVLGAATASDAPPSAAPLAQRSRSGGPVGALGGSVRRLPGGSARVTALLDSALESRIGSDVEAELVITGQVRARGGWQSATAVVRSVGADSTDPVGVARPGLVDPAVGEKVLLEVAPDRDASGSASSAARAGPTPGRPVNRRGRRVTRAGAGDDRRPRGEHRGARGAVGLGLRSGQAAACTRASRSSSEPTTLTR